MDQEVKFGSEPRQWGRGEQEVARRSETRKANLEVKVARREDPPKPNEKMNQDAERHPALTSDDPVDGLLKVFMADVRVEVPGSDQRRLVADVGDVGPCTPPPAAKKQNKTHVIITFRFGVRSHVFGRYVPVNPGVAAAIFLASVSLSTLGSNLMGRRCTRKMDARPLMSGGPDGSHNNKFDCEGPLSLLSPSAHCA